ncbi:DEAD/DEAH box helicase [Paenibacillus tyrfis]|uniref:DEAD/DEAH box helicase n=1 Tax=Paenibacillus tyrfis TaxID=1501230 RepID=UPI000B593279|nr:helicase-related protein [Paenibacillus tyrfis]
MKAFVYAAMTADGCSWHVSLDMRADRDYWTDQAGGRFKLRVLEPALSFGQACEIKRKLKASSSSSNMLESLRTAAREIGLHPEAVADWKLWDWAGTADGLSDEARHFANRTMNAMCLSMNGRYLLMEEFMGLMQHEGSQAVAESPAYFLQLAWIQGRVELEAGVELDRSEGRRWSLLPQAWKGKCKRCGSQGMFGGQAGIEASPVRWTQCADCGGPCAYCEACLTMGRSRYCTPIVRANNSPDVTIMPLADEDMEIYLRSWGLSDVQAEASGSALQFLKANKSLSREKAEDPHAPRFLIWAVTGAGKTEMIFPMVQYTLAKGGRVAIATPRRDVVLELKPRLEKAFPHTKVVTLYGGSEQRWEQGELTLATTHQLMRFRQAFDLVIVDEIDAYPYHNNPMLLYAAEQVCASGGAYILLSATPPEELQRAVKRNRLPHARVAARYHRHPLPEPSLLSCPPLRQMLAQNGLNGKLKGHLASSLERGAQVFVFVPKIAMVEPFVTLLRQSFPSVNVQGTSSKDADRSQKVTDFRATSIRMLVTTTILERGVTIPKSDVFIIDADSPVFDSAALVQMAGRAGRSAQDPRGRVYFAAKEKTRSQAHARRQIAEMNVIARKKGYID